MHQALHAPVWTGAGVYAAQGSWPLQPHASPASPPRHRPRQADPTDRFTQPSCKWHVRVSPAAPAAAENGSGADPPVLSSLARVHATFWALDEAAGLEMQAGPGVARSQNGGGEAGTPAAPPADLAAVDPNATPPALPATLVQNRRLTAEDHWQDVRHLDFQLAGARYEPGDVLSVLPQQDWQAVCKVLEVSAACASGWRSGGNWLGVMPCLLSAQRLPSPAPEAWPRAPCSGLRRAPGQPGHHVTPRQARPGAGLQRG